jgi:hypothetical protein
VVQIDFVGHAPILADTTSDTAPPGRPAMGGPQTPAIPSARDTVSRR